MSRELVRDEDLGEDDWEEDDALVIEGKEQMRALSEKEQNGEMVLHDTPNDTWGVMIFVIVKDIGEMVECQGSRSQIFRSLFAIMAMIMNLTMQFAILWWVFEYVVAPAVATIQLNYGQFHRQCFDSEGVFSQAEWNAFPADIKGNLCHAGLSQPVFLGGILFLWTLAMLVEFRENFNLHRHIRSIANLPYGISHGDQVLEQDCDGETNYLLVALSPTSRAILYTLIVIPKYLIILVLTVIGWRWLSASESFGDLILNSLALQFVVTIDELIFSSVFPEKMVERVTRLKLACPKVTFKDDADKEKNEEGEIMFLYTRSLCFLLLAAGLLAGYIHFFQAVLPGYDYDLGPICRADAQGQAMPCGNFLAKGCFPYGPENPTRKLISMAVHEV